MLKVQIVLDKEKILKEAVYNFEELQSIVDRFMTQTCELRKESDGFYVGDNTNSDYISIMSSIQKLKEASWFVNNVKVWKWYACDDDTGEKDASVDDIKKRYAIENANS